jgi:hypothetical protein
MLVPVFTNRNPFSGLCTVGPKSLYPAYIPISNNIRSRYFNLNNFIRAIYKKPLPGGQGKIKKEKNSFTGQRCC